MRINFSRLDFESECIHDCATGNGFIISEPAFADVDKNIRNYNGPRSPRYGSTLSDSSAGGSNIFREMYSCKCGHIVGAQFEGETCPLCGTKIEYVDTNIKYTGWLDFYPYHVISPIYYRRLESAISRKNVEDIISNENLITAQGVIRKHTDNIESKKGTLVYHNIGLKSFYDNFEEIMLYFKSKRKQKADLIDQLLDEKDMLWTSKIPVYSTVLRPMSHNTENFWFTPIDREIAPLTQITINLKNANPIEVPLYLYQAQQRVNKLWDINFQLIDGKHGWIRGNCIGGSFNNSGRQVIVLDPSLKMDEVDISYRAFMVQYRGLIIKEIIKDKGWTITKATNYLTSQYDYNDYIYSIMQKLVDRGISIIINRNPEIAGL